MEDTPYWAYYPSLIPNGQNDQSNFISMYQQLENYVSDYNVNTPRGIYLSRRKSCVWSDDTSLTGVEAQRSTSKYFSYGQLPRHNWDNAPIGLNQLKIWLEDLFGLTFNYCLAHIYRNGEDKIDRHNDKEAMNTPIVSVSLGATRKFRFQRIGVSVGYEKEFILRGGDVLLMKIGCQHVYEHWVPIEKKVTQPRINLTFRINQS